MEIAAKGRVIRVPEAAKGVARFSFRQLCEQPLGASDYLRIAREFHTLILEAIPVMDYPQRNAAKRFIALIDTLYDNAVKLVASAAAEPPALYLRDRRLRGERVQAHRLAPVRDALGRIPGAAARTPHPRRLRLDRRNRRDLSGRRMLHRTAKSALGIRRMIWHNVLQEAL